MPATLMRLTRSETGTTAIEYALYIALVAFALIGVLQM